MIQFREDEHLEIVELAHKAKKAVCKLMEALEDKGAYDEDSKTDTEYRSRGTSMRRYDDSRYRY